MSAYHFFTELKRRNVYKVGAAYAAVAWLVIQIASSTFPPLEIPMWALRLVIVLVLLGFPIALVLAWAFEVTPEGIRRTPSTAETTSARSKKWHGWVVIAVVALAATGWFFFGKPLSLPLKRNPRQMGEAPAKSIAVLPFASLSEDKANAYFAEGIQDEILTRLARISDLKVISRTSTLRYKSAGENLLEIARQLGVAHVLEGSIQKSGDRVRINVQLINAQTDTHLWAETYDRTLTDMFAIESEVAQRVADSLRVTLTGAEKATLANRPTENTEAYDAYLRGLALVASNRETPEVFQAAADFFEKAVQLDPRFALGWARAAIAHSRIYWLGFDRSPALVEKAREAVEKARELNPDLGETILARGYYEYLVVRDYNAGWSAFKDAVSRLPNNADALVALSLIERRMGRWAEALAHQEQAARLDPQNVPVLSHLGVTYFAMKRFADAHAIVDRLLALAPDNPQVLAGLARLYLAEGDLEAAEKAMLFVQPAPNNDYIFEIQVRLPMIAGRYADAIRMLENVLAQRPPPAGFITGKYRYLLGFAKELAGDIAAPPPIYEEARVELLQFSEAQPDLAEAQMYLAFVEAGLGNKEAAVRAAEKAIALRPASADTFKQGMFEEALTRVKARFGETDTAIAELQRLLATNHFGPEQIALTPALLRLDPVWKPLREDARFRDLAKMK